MPNDEREVDRLDLYHYVFVELLDGDLYTAPLENIGVRRVLDVGTGTGLWAAEMAEYASVGLDGTSRY